jgi:hypothetical protein
MNKFQKLSHLKRLVQKEMLQMKKERMPEAIKPFLNFHTNSLTLFSSRFDFTEICDSLLL